MRQRRRWKPCGKKWRHCMPERETAAQLLDRIVAMVAMLSRETEHGGGVPIDDIARRLDTTGPQVLRGIRILTDAADSSEHDELRSLLAFQEGDRITVSSMGPYRRPIRLTSEELLALKVALLPEAERLSEGLRELVGLEPSEEPTTHPTPFIQGDEAAVVDLVRTAIAVRRKLRIAYAGDGDAEPSTRVIHPHGILSAHGRFYIVAWCESANDWRTRFRADRILDAELLEEVFEARTDVPTTESREQLFAQPDDVDDVTVRFSPNIARWIAERYPSHVQHDDGSVEITFQVASTDWLVGNVLQYGAEAEVLGPPAYREAVRRAVAG